MARDSIGCQGPFVHEGNKMPYADMPGFKNHGIDSESLNIYVCVFYKLKQN